MSRIKHYVQPSAELILRGESQEEFDELLFAYMEEFQPINATETLLVHRMAKHRWFLHRGDRLEHEAFVRAGGGLPAELGSIMRYQDMNRRGFDQSLKFLQRLQNERREKGNGFVSQKPDRRLTLVKPTIH